MRRLSDDAGPARLAGLRDLNPGYFALVMATGIVYRAAYLDRFRLLGRTGQRVGRQRDMVPVVVGTQSVAVAATALPASGALTALAVACWPVGAVLYLGIATLVLAALLLFSAGPAGITSPYWVFMGAPAISMLAGAQILRLPPDPLTAVTRPVIAGLSVAAWAFGTWLIPPLIAFGAWRHLVRRVRLRYEPGLWSIVFPLGMYGVASP